MNPGKALLAAAALLPLSACNFVVSEQPWFTAASGPQLKDGLWANLDSPNCAFDPASPITDWPKCASPMMIRGSVYSGPPSGEAAEAPGALTDASKWQPIEHVLVEGDPQIDQIAIPLDMTKQAPGAAGREMKPIHLYLAVRPTAKDAEGRITEAQRWPVLCGPMPKKPREKNGVPIFTSDRPYKGIRVKDEFCMAESAAALRAAAVSSEVAAKEGGFTIVTSRWIRDGL
ncbi:MAG TPA: hypothetical protein VFV30_02325 [Novosphingobium sp.]|nr:hypothetical protein [Novosphingobium sp.]